VTRALPVVVLLAAGCAAGVPFHRAPTPGPETGGWAELRDRASRRAALYDGFVHRAGASVTWLSPAVREAALRRQAEWQGLGPAELEQALAAGRAEAARGEEFLVAFYTADRRANDLDGRKSVWHLELDDGERRLPASEVEGLRADATVRQLYPYVDPFQQLYRVRFAWTGAPLAARPFTLRIASALGELALDFGPEGLRTVPARLTP
jgi:hypothetical protein